MQRSRALTWLALAMFLTQSTYADDWRNPDSPVRSRAYLNAWMLQEDLTNFPLRLALDASSLPIVQESPTKGIAIVDSAGKRLALECVGPDEDARVIVYVLVPFVRAAKAGQFLDIYYGNPDESPVDSPPLWDSHYVLAIPSHASVDHSGKGTSVTPVGSATWNDGLTLNEQEGYLSIAPGETPWSLANHITISVRFKVHDSPGLQTLASARRKDGPEQWFNFGLKIPDIVHTNATSEGRRAPELNVSGIAPNEWHAATVVYDGIQKTRTICIDGVALQRDDALPGPLGVDEIRIGRGMLHFDPWQVNGQIDEVRISDVARSNSWVRAETASLANDNAFACIAPPQKRGDPPPPPSEFTLLAPADGFASRARIGTFFEWRPSAGATTYRLQLFDSPTAESPALDLDLGPATSHQATASLAPGKTMYWTVVAGNAQGEAPAPERRAISFYDWTEPPVEEPEDAILPALSPARGAEFVLEGYLRKRIDKVIHRYFMETPESSPAILQVFRDRDKSPVRDPLVPWAGEFAGKYLTAAQLTWRLTHDDDLKSTIDAFARDLIACQADNGYLGPFPESSRLTGGNWDVWGHYHCMLGLMLYYEDTDFEPALDACAKAADLLFETFGPGGPTLTNDGAGGQMNMAVCHGLVLLYKKTGVERYIDLANYIVHEAWNEGGAGRYLESALAGKPVVDFPQHRWEAIHDWQALAELYWQTGDEQYRRAFEHIWHSAVGGDRHNTGGLTSGEGFTGSPYNQGAIETCCTVAWIAFSIDMLRLTGDSKVADEIEWSTLNSALGAIPYSGRACAYNVPMDGTRVYGVELPWQAPKAGPDLNCCAVNANRPLGMISDWALMENRDGIVLNFYGPGSYAATLPSGNRIALRQETAYPAEGHIAISIETNEPDEFAIAFRIPQWSGKTRLAVNGQTEDSVAPGSYHAIARKWKSGDRIEIELDFSPWFWPGEDVYAGKTSIYRGPILLSYDARYNDLNPADLTAFDAQSLQLEPVHWEGPIEPWMLVKAKAADGAEIRLVDFSSAGQTGNQYVSWLPAAGAPAPGAILKDR